MNTCPACTLPMDVAAASVSASVCSFCQEAATGDISASIPVVRS